MSDDEVRQMLERRAGDVSADPEAWERIESRLGQPANGVREVHHLRPLLAIIAAAAVVVAIVAVTATQPDGTQDVVAAGSGQAADGSDADRGLTEDR